MASIYKRPKGKNIQRHLQCYRQDGKRKQVWESCFSFKETKARKLEIESQQEGGSFAEPNNLILLQKLAADPQTMQTLLKLLQTP